MKYLAGLLLLTVLAAAEDAPSKPKGEKAPPKWAGEQQPTDKFVLLEAERASEVAPPFVLEERLDASGKKCAMIPRRRTPKENAEDVGGKLVLRFKLRKGGRYRLWARTHWKDGCGNSVRLKVDDQPVLTLGQDGTYEVWHWVDLKMRTLDLQPGEHVMEIHGKEDAIKVDQIFLTTDHRYVPVGIER